MLSPSGITLSGTGYLTAITADGRKFSVDVVGTSAEHDLALLKLRTEPGDSFACIDLSKVMDSEPGTPVLAFSNMFHVATGNEPVSLVHGVIAARIPLEATQGRWKFPLKSPVWLVDAITNNSGAAGGLLTDTNGTPIGLIGREIRHAASRTWVNYAVPLTTLKPIIETLMSGRKLDPRPKDSETNIPMISDQELTARFGLTMLPNVVERTPAWIDAVAKDSIAAKAELQRGDLIVMVDDTVITSVTDFQQQLARFRSGDRVSLTINREQQLLASGIADSVTALRRAVRRQPAGKWSNPQNYPGQLVEARQCGIAAYRQADACRSPKYGNMLHAADNVG